MGWRDMNPIYLFIFAALRFIICLFLQRCSFCFIGARVELGYRPNYCQLKLLLSHTCQAMHARHNLVQCFHKDSIREQSSWWSPWQSTCIWDSQLATVIVLKASCIYSLLTRLARVASQLLPSIECIVFLLISLWIWHRLLGEFGGVRVDVI
jgi:hypothetical protein